MKNGDDLVDFLRQINRRDSDVVSNTTDGRDSDIVTNTTDGRVQKFNIISPPSPPSPTFSLSSKRKARKNQRNYNIFGIHWIFWLLLISTIILFILNIKKKIIINLCINAFEIVLLVFFMINYEEQKNDFTLPFIIVMVFGLLLGTNINS